MTKLNIFKLKFNFVDNYRKWLVIKQYAPSFYSSTPVDGSDSTTLINVGIKNKSLTIHVKIKNDY